MSPSESEQNSGIGTSPQLSGGRWSNRWECLEEVAQPCPRTAPRSIFEGADPEQLPAVTDSYGTHLHLNFQLALEEFLDRRPTAITRSWACTARRQR